MYCANHLFNSKYTEYHSYQPCFGWQAGTGLPGFHRDMRCLGQAGYFFVWPVEASCCSCFKLQIVSRKLLVFIHLFCFILLNCSVFTIFVSSLYFYLFLCRLLVDFSELLIFQDLLFLFNLLVFEVVHFLRL